MAENEKLENGEFLEDKTVDNSYKLDDILNILNSVFKDPGCLSLFLEKLSEISNDEKEIKSILKNVLSEELKKNKNELEKYKNLYIKYKIEKESYEKQIEELCKKTSDIDVLCGKIELLTQQNEKINIDKDEYFSKLNQQIGLNFLLEKEKDKFEEKYNASIETLAENTQKIKDLEESIKEKKEEISVHKKDKEELQGQVIFFDTEKSSLLQKIESLSTENKGLIQKLEVSSSSYTEQKKQFEQLQSKYEILLLKETILNEFLVLKMDMLKNAYEIFMNFKDRTRNNLKAVFEVDTFFGFISNSMQWDRIAGIWEQTKVKIINDDSEDVNELRQLFLILFEIYNSGYNDAPYTLISPEIGAKYNRNEQLIKNQKSDGFILDILLEGYITKKTNTIHKSIIVVE